MRPRASAGHGELALRGVLLVFLLALGTLLAGCGGSEDEADIDVPVSPEEASSVVVRVSGTEGLAYSGTYGTLVGSLEPVDDAIVGAEPTDYEVEVRAGVLDGVIAGFRKSQPGQGELRVQTLADEKVVVESRTLAELGTANADWLPQDTGPPEGIPPEGEMFLPGEEDPQGEEGSPDDVEVTSEG
jgi:hypothetical protein